MNLLNFFNTVNNCTGGVGGRVDRLPRGRHACRVRPPVAEDGAAIVALDADIIGIVEIENDGYGPTVRSQFLVDKLNAATAARHLRILMSTRLRARSTRSARMRLGLASSTSRPR